ncbi:MAG: D-aminoacyl-tRNA deacylase [Candidatus Kapabacteria bacterium]|jgi:D-tyrosyl-tRNA(Tyr) deacylase|nr:D-aminoacyl-tRNA deacylase [Candidatus Kapabacteria bacterium]
MRVLLQRVKQASVTVNGIITGQIAHGILVFVGIAASDTVHEIEWMSHKITNLRIFSDDEGKMNLSVSDVQGGILLVSQFTLYGDAQKGLRPSYINAAPPTIAEPLYNQMLEHLRNKSGLRVEAGIFAAMMDVELINDGPVTIWLEREAEEQTKSSTQTA